MFFAVLNVISDIIMVYDGADSRLIESMWVPNCELTTVKDLLQIIGTNYWMVYLDIEDVF